MTNFRKARWCKLPDESWGLRVDGPDVEAGLPVVAQTKAGKRSYHRVTEVMSTSEQYGNADCRFEDLSDDELPADAHADADGPAVQWDNAPPVTSVAATRRLQGFLQEALLHHVVLVRDGELWTFRDGDPETPGYWDDVENMCKWFDLPFDADAVRNAGFERAGDLHWQKSGEKDDLPF